MTVIARDPAVATRVEVDDAAVVVRETVVPQLNADLSAYADVPLAAAVPLHANRGLTSNGFNLVGAGFRLEAEEAEQLLAMDPCHVWVLYEMSPVLSQLCRRRA